MNTYPKLLWILCSFLSASLGAETVQWTGASDDRWDNSNNWSTASQPDSSSSVVFDETGTLGGNLGTTVYVQRAIAGSLTVDRPGWTLRPMGKRSAVLDIAEGSMIFTDRFLGAASTPVFFGGVNKRNLRLRFGNANSSIVNNGSGVVTFDAAENNRKGFGIVSLGKEPVNLYLDGSGNFVFRNGIVFAGIDRFGTAPTFTGEFRIEGGLLAMDKALLARGGRVTIGPGAQFSPQTNIVIGSDEGVQPAVVDARGIAGEFGVLFATGSNAVLRVDAETDLTFKFYNGGDLSVEGYVKGATQLRMKSLTVDPILGVLRINGEVVPYRVDSEGNLPF